MNQRWCNCLQTQTLTLKCTESILRISGEVDCITYVLSRVFRSVLGLTARKSSHVSRCGPATMLGRGVSWGIGSIDAVEGDIGTRSVEFSEFDEDFWPWPFLQSQQLQTKRHKNFYQVSFAQKSYDKKSLVSQFSPCECSMPLHVSLLVMRIALLARLVI